MVFFQALLLAGYGYAHLLTRFLNPGKVLLVHLGLMTCAFATLPIALPSGWGKPPEYGEALWLLALFTAAVGLPFLAVSANGPLLQTWFSQSGHEQAKDPYFLYAASNIGSFAALLLYPLALEPFLTLREQAHWWMAGFAALAMLIVTCGLPIARREPHEERASTLAAPAELGWRERLAWVGLSFVPSGLLVSVTTHISTGAVAEMVGI
jgi:hypothetical protein